MEPVVVHRPATVVDEYHNEVGGALAEFARLLALVAPRYSEPVEPGRHPVLIGYTLTFPGVVTGILEGDVIAVRGATCPVAGGPAETWRYMDGTLAGDVVEVQFVKG